MPFKEASRRVQLAEESVSKESSKNVSWADADMGRMDREATKATTACVRVILIFIGYWYLFFIFPVPPPATVLLSYTDSF
jgi:hypothetical protein